MRKYRRKGVILLVFDSMEEAENALRLGIQPSIANKAMTWVGIKDPGSFVSDLPQQSRCVNSYNHEKEFVISIEIAGHGSVTSIVNSDEKDLTHCNNPFDPNFHIKHVILPSHMVIGNEVDIDARTILEKFIKNCIRSLGVQMIPKNIKQNLDMYVKKNVEYFDFIAHDDTVFVFLCYITHGNNIAVTETCSRFMDSTVTDLYGIYKRVILLS